MLIHSYIQTSTTYIYNTHIHTYISKVLVYVCIVFACQFRSTETHIFKQLKNHLHTYIHVKSTLAA